MPRRRVERRSGRATDATGAAAPPRPTTGLVALTWFWVVLALALAVALAVLALRQACGLQLIFFLGAAGIDRGRRACSARWPPGRTGEAFAHLLSLLVLAWAGVVAAREILPRVGYAKESRTWM